MFIANLRQPWPQAKQRHQPALAVPSPDLSWVARSGSRRRCSRRLRA